MKNNKIKLNACSLSNNTASLLLLSQVLIALFVLVYNTSTHAAIGMIPYYQPMVSEGNYWKYNLSDLNSGQDLGQIEQSILPGLVNFNGELAYAYKLNNGSNYEVDYLASKPDGLYQYGSEIYHNDALEGRLYYNNSPRLLFTSIANQGDRISTSGTFNLHMPGYGSFQLNYTEETIIHGIESVTVPFGTYDALMIERSTLFESSLLDIRESYNENIWLAENIGILQMQTLSSTESLDYQLAAVPIPPSIWFILSALFMLSMTMKKKFNFRKNEWSL